ncbi:MAG: hypothetical protein WCJ19_04050 [bacterium]
MHLDITFSKIISNIFDPRITNLLFLLYFSLFVLKSFFLAGFIIIYSCISLFFLNKKQNNIDHLDDYNFNNISIRLIRYSTFILTIILDIILLIANYFSTNQTGIIFFSLHIGISLLVMLITFFLHFKISAHITFNGLIMLYLFSPMYLQIILFCIFTLIVGYARINLKKHNIYQVGTAFLIVMISFIIFDLLINVWI